MQREKGKTVGQVYSNVITQRNKLGIKKGWKKQGKNKATERLNTFSSVIKIDKNFKINTLYYGDRPSTIINIFKIIKNIESVKGLKIPSFNENTTYEDIIKEISNKFDLIKKIENKKNNEEWDSINFDGKNIVLQKFTHSTSLFFPLESINIINEYKYQKALRYVFGALIKKYGIECFSKSACFNYHLEYISDYYEENISDNLNEYNFPEEQDILRDVDEKYYYYKIASDCVKEYMTGNIDNINNILDFESVFDCEFKQNAFEVFKTFKELLKYDFNISDFFTETGLIEFEEYPVYPDEYCMIVGSVNDKVFSSYEDFINEKYGNGGVVPLSIKKQFNLKGESSNVENEKGLLLLTKLNELILNF